MQKRMFCVLGFLIILFFGSSIVLGADSGFCPIPSAGNKAIPNLPQQRILTSEKNYSVPRNQVLLEMGTGTWWGGCPYAAVAVDSLEKLKGDSVAILEYHALDFFENDDAWGRLDYYTIWGIPYAKFDGRDSVLGGWDVSEYLDAYNAMMALPSPCTLSISTDYNSTTRRLWVKAEVFAVDTFSDAHLRYAIAESHIYYPWQWLDSLHHVTRKMLPDYNGVAIPPQNPYDTFVDSQTFVLDPTWNDKNCYVVVFVQRDDPGMIKPVFRSAKSGLFSPWVFGDANGDGMVDVADVVYLIDYLFMGVSAPDPLASGDPNDDCIIDVGDVVYLINYLFIAGPEPFEGCAL